MPCACCSTPETRQKQAVLDRIVEHVLDNLPLVTSYSQAQKSIPTLLHGITLPLPTSLFAQRNALDQFFQTTREICPHTAFTLHTFTYFGLGDALATAWLTATASVFMNWRDSVARFNIMPLLDTRIVEVRLDALYKTIACRLRLVSVAFQFMRELLNQARPHADYAAYLFLVLANALITTCQQDLAQVYGMVRHQDKARLLSCLIFQRSTIVITRFRLLYANGAELVAVQRDLTNVERDVAAGLDTIEGWTEIKAEMIKEQAPMRVLGIAELGADCSDKGVEMLLG